MKYIAILITSFNRKDQTLACLKSIYLQKNISNIIMEIFLVVDGSTDGTYEEVKKHFPNVNLIQGDGSLYWAGGMRLSYNYTTKINKKFDYYLLLNDDTILYDNAFEILINDLYKLESTPSILVGSTKSYHSIENKFTYGGRILKNNYNLKSQIVIPNKISPQICDLGNANIMLIPSLIIDKIGFLSDKFTHGIADFEYTLRAKMEGFKSYISSNYLGTCETNDNQLKHLKNSKKTNLKNRILYLYSVKGLSYKEYMFFIKTYFPLYLPQAWLFLWMKTFFPFFWDKLKKRIK